MLRFVTALEANRENAFVRAQGLGGGHQDFIGTAWDNSPVCRLADKLDGLVAARFDGRTQRNIKFFHLRHGITNGAGRIKPCDRQICAPIAIHTRVLQDGILLEFVGPTPVIESNQVRQGDAAIQHLTAEKNVQRTAQF